MCGRPESRESAPSASVHQDHTCFGCAGLEAKLKALAAKRKLADLSVGPVLTWTTKRMLEHVEKVLAIPGGRWLRSSCT